jgi:phosphoesterase RecJ-like protein
LPKEALLPIYVSIVGDTGSFRFSNATPKSHRIAAELIEAGVKPRKVYKKLFEAYTIGRMKLLGMVLTDLKVSEDGRIAWMKVTTEMMKTTGCFNGETDGFADIPRSLAGVQISIMFRETGDGGVKLSFRSEPPVDIAPLARSFGGGGHGSAAGAILKGDIDIIESEVLSAAESYLVGKQWEGIPGD